MSRRMVSILGAAAALFAVSAPAASAASAADIAEPNLPYCYGATYGGNTAQICAAENVVIGNGWVDPEMSTACIIKLPILAATTTFTTAAIAEPVIPHPCTWVGSAVSGVEATGFEPSGAALHGPTIVGLSVRWRGYDAGTLYVDGATTPVGAEPTCVGGDCPSALEAAVQLVNNVANATVTK